MTPLEPGFAEDDLAAPTIRDPFGLSPTAASVAPAPPPSPPPPKRASGIDAGAWDLFAPRADQTLPSVGAAPRSPLGASEIAALEVYAKITAAVRRDGATPATLARFGLDAASWAETERFYAERFAASPSLARAFATMLSRVRG